MAVALLDIPLRGNFFASAMREVISMSLHANAPDVAVADTPDFELEEGQGRPTQAQRFAYWARAGLDPAFVRERLPVDIDGPVKTGTAALRELSKRVHVREGTHVHEECEVLELVRASLEALQTVIAAAEDARSAIIDALAEEITDEAFSTFIFDTIAAVDELATHHSIEGVWVGDVKVHQAAPDRLRFEVTGSVDVGLQWGSNSDVARGDGVEADENFKFELTFNASTLTPTDFEDSQYTLDLGKWERDHFEREEEDWSGT
ncbi:hypothetical protein D3C71_1202920 [compost metagenome]